MMKCAGGDAYQAGANQEQVSPTENRESWVSGTHLTP